MLEVSPSSLLPVVEKGDIMVVVVACVLSMVGVFGDRLLSFTLS
jgi:hypothetical protein